MNSCHHRDPSSGQRLTSERQLREVPSIVRARIGSPPEDWKAPRSTLGRLYSADTYTGEPSSLPPKALIIDWEVPSGSGSVSGTGVYPLDWLRWNCGAEPSRDEGASAWDLLGACTGQSGETVKASVLGESRRGGLPRRFHPARLLCGTGDASVLTPWIEEGQEDRALRFLKNRAQERCSALTSWSFGQLLTNDEVLWKASLSLARDGVVLLSGCGTHSTAPEDGKDLEFSVVRAAQRLGWSVMPTLYGDTFTVEATSDPINAAYSPCDLEGHQDLAYYESPPGLQLLHCTRFDAGLRGGESLLHDVVAAADALREVNPRAFVTLATVPLTLQKVHYRRSQPAHMVYRRPMIAVESEGALGAALGAALGRGSSLSEADWARAAHAAGEVRSVSWAPPFEGALRSVSAAVAEDHCQAVGELGKILDTMLASGTGGLCFRLREGDMAVFNNRRMLHGRKAFGPDPADPTPMPADGLSRRLRGCYVNVDDFLNRLETLCSLYGGRKLIAPVSNGSWD
jgi:hypothetical protein